MIFVYCIQLVAQIFPLVFFHFFRDLFFSHVWRQYQQSSSLAAFRCDNQGLILNINTVGEELLGYKQAEIKGLGLDDVTYTEDLENEKILINELIQGVFPLLTRQKRYIRKDGKVILALATLTIKRTFLGYQYFGFIKLIDNSPVHQQISHHALATINHEIRHSLQNIVVLGHQLLESPALDGVKKAANSILQSGHQIKHILDYFYTSDFVYPPLNNILFNTFQPFTLIDNLFTYYQVRATLKDLQWHTTFSGKQNLYVVGNDVFLQQIIHNLLSNAVEYTHQGFIHIDYQLVLHRHEGKAVLNLIIQDTGPGFSFHENIVANTDHRDINTRRGLGLPIINQLITLLNGRCLVDSNTQGSRVSISIPFTVASSQHVPRLTNKKPKKPIKILILDDDSLHVWWLKKMIEVLPCEPVVVDTTEKARETLLHTQFDLLIFDLNLELTNSSSLIREIYHSKAQFLYQQIFVITGFDELSREVATVIPYVDKVFTKPINQHDFLQELHLLYDH
ncbi:MAG: hypothetical protein B7Z60_08430 [Ferrovum sp. 37-45-19]|nr:MAG: hypothetical protein B7Z65_08640 [Ferrovum sp. 21-44-67]OYV93490.1 MAG: hypothetical protein B7Z60_08430 [Ferrovum sp. 37-45-19]OZB33100.1 MAG: hypothetical protein B7X47_05045 [Ferrovum sp. 34-44-207]HQT82211.1 ATP-binding protein [Ferrovaceae bacterium]HQU07294.1 ATP-binding protein [Ferrovaceae bacterium]